ncbi:MAG: hypothetical protein HPM95_05610 [Alphaproteobacteria bacterium]|nr:hypothetical protein [Alphaproteobacteria bacterium]
MQDPPWSALQRLLPWAMDRAAAEGGVPAAWAPGAVLPAVLAGAAGAADVDGWLYPSVSRAASASTLRIDSSSRNCSAVISDGDSGDRSPSTGQRWLFER